MPGKIVESEDIGMEDDLDTSLEDYKPSKKQKKGKKSKDEKKPKKKKGTVEGQPDETDTPPPKKKKRASVEEPPASETTSNGDAVRGSSAKKHKSKSVNGTPLMKDLPHSSEESGSDSGHETEPKPKKTGKAVVNGVSTKKLKRQASSSPEQGASVLTPSHSSEESSIDSEKEAEELTPEQKAGAFSNFRISKETIQLLQARGVTYLFDIQVKTFDFVFDGNDVVGQARTGTGKTFSFAIPLIEKLQSSPEERKRGRPPKVLVLVPTRELALQVSRDFKDITKKLSVACFYGGSPYNPQLDNIRNGIDILVGTPGRIKDHLQNNKLDLSKLVHVVLDEVDQMLDMGFAEQVEEILSAAYRKDSENNPQTLLFSATCPHWVYAVAKKYMRPEYNHVDLIGQKTKKTATTVEHLAIMCHWTKRASVIGDVIQVYSGSHGRTIVFCETKREVDELTHNESIKQVAQPLHGDIAQKQRELTLKGFRNGSFEVLVATNVAARGLDIPEVDLVIQCSPPKDVDSYIHRSGRTGRAGRTGVCICFYQHKEEQMLRYVEYKAGITFKRVSVPTAHEIIQASSKDALRFLDSVPPAAIEYFRSAAEKLVEERGAVEALAAALAHISGAKSIEQRSLLSCDAGFVTMVLTCSIEMHTMSYAWRGLKEQLGEDIDSKITRLTFVKGKTGVCFDVPEENVKEILEKWQDSRRWQLCVATELPELEEAPSRDHGSRFGGRSSFGRGRGGRNDRSRGGRNDRSRGGRNNRGRGGRNDRREGQKRNFDQAFNY
uniref:Nucleolar RNA helicase 2 n=1 Tax=Lepisosteus oculatus TaxID=7918 RepID=W5MRW7_LEPOC|nr:PREDICTED: nucleolar RNA helicase 2 [Lepisosteus oculatus]